MPEEMFQETPADTISNSRRRRRKWIAGMILALPIVGRAGDAAKNGGGGAALGLVRDPRADSSRRRSRVAPMRTSGGLGTDETRPRTVASSSYSSPRPKRRCEYYVTAALCAARRRRRSPTTSIDCTERSALRSTRPGAFDVDRGLIVDGVSARDIRLFGEASTYWHRGIQMRGRWIAEPTAPVAGEGHLRRRGSQRKECNDVPRLGTLSAVAERRPDQPPAALPSPAVTLDEMARAVAKVVKAIPRGQVLSYSQVALRAGMPGNPRGVVRALKHDHERALVAGDPLRRHGGAADGPHAALEAQGRGARDQGSARTSVTSRREPPPIESSTGSALTKRPSDRHGSFRGFERQLDQSRASALRDETCRHSGHGASRTSEFTTALAPIATSFPIEIGPNSFAPAAT